MSEFMLQGVANGDAADGWSLTGALTIYTAAQAHDALREALAAMPPADADADAEAAPWHLHAQALGEADGAAVQLLVATAHSLRRAGRRPCLVGASPALLAVARALGATPEGRCCGWDWQTA